MDAPCSTKTIRRHLNNEKIKHKKRIYHPRLTIKHKEKRLEYAHQYQTMSAKEWQSKKENFVNIKNTEISSGCSLQYKNN